MNGGCRTNFRFHIRAVVFHIRAVVSITVHVVFFFVCRRQCCDKIDTVRTITIMGLIIMTRTSTILFKLRVLYYHCRLYSAHMQSTWQLPTVHMRCTCECTLHKYN